MKYYCNNCKKHTLIRIMPDYSSSHLWCNDCGLPIKRENLVIPKYLDLLIEHWGLLWDEFSLGETSLRKEYYCNLYKKTINEIKNELSKYYDCAVWNEDCKYKFE